MYNYTLTIKDSPFERNFTDLKECLYYILLREDAGKVADIISSIYDPEDESWIDTYMQGYQLASDVEVAVAIYADKIHPELQAYDKLLRRLSATWAMDINEAFDNEGFETNTIDLLELENEGYSITRSKE